VGTKSRVVESSLGVRERVHFMVKDPWGNNGLDEGMNTDQHIPSFSSAPSLLLECSPR